LEKFFSRPIRIRSTQWGVGTQFHDTFNPWLQFFNNPRVVNRLSNYKLMRATLKLKFVVSGNAFHYGRAVAAYNPLAAFDQLTLNRAFINADLVAATQRPHVFLNPTTSQGGEITCPFFYHLNMVDVTQSDWTDLGAVTIQSIQNLKHANGATDTVSITTFAWAEDVEFAIPTEVEPNSIVPQSDEYGVGPISRPANIAATIANKLTSIPVIAPFAKATEIGMRAAGAIAVLFGYSSPPQLGFTNVRPVPVLDIAVTDTPAAVAKLSITSKQELTVDPRVAGLNGVDELSINGIASRESYLTSFNWAVGINPEEKLFSCLVDPGVKRIQVDPTIGDEIHLPACAFASLPFTTWRGSMNFRFQVVCSNYHKGRLKIVYDPERGGGSSEYNTAYTTIVDLAETTDFTVTCGWGQPTTYRLVSKLYDEVSMFRDTLILPYTAGTNLYGNGVISVYVVNELTVPNTTIDNDIAINVFVSMGPDFEVADPSADIAGLSLTPKPIPPPAALFDIEPQSEEYIQQEDAPNSAVSAAVMGNVTSNVDYTNLVHYGESIKSFRTLLKRFNVHELLPVTVANTATRVRSTFYRPMYPFEPGYNSTGGTVPFQTQAGDFVRANMTLVKYLSVAFVGQRGGMRWMFDCSDILRAPWKVEIARGANPIPVNSIKNIPVITEPTKSSGIAELFADSAEFNGALGTAISNTVNSILTAEIPYYSEYRFTPTKRLTSMVAKPQAMPGFAMRVSGEFRNTDFVTTRCATAEDHNMFFYTGPPRFYKHVAPPL